MHCIWQRKGHNLKNLRHAKQPTTCKTSTTRGAQFSFLPLRGILKKALKDSANQKFWPLRGNCAFFPSQHVFFLLIWG